MITKKQRQECILELLKERNKYMKLAKEYEKILDWILSRFYSIGAPLNDNILKFNKKQLLFLLDIANTVSYGIEKEKNNE